MVETDTTSRHAVPFPPLEFSAQHGKIHLNGQPVSLRGINWFGFELVDNHPHALWANSLQAYVDIIKHNGFNAVRLTMSAETMLNLDSAKALNINKDLNPALGGPNVTAGAVLDALVGACRQANILVMLNMHRMTPGGEITELWYTGEWPESRVIQAWRAVVARYKNHPHVFAMDLKNEPHGRAAWGGGDYSTDWAAAAERIGNAILADNPKLLIFVAGVTYRFDQGIWGDDVGGAQARPINLSVRDRVVYTPHAYIHWRYPNKEGHDNRRYWDACFGDLARTGDATVVLGEYGYTPEDLLDTQWVNDLEAYVTQLGLDSSFYWCLNNNADKNHGLLLGDWSTVDGRKMAVIERFVPNPTAFDFRPAIVPAAMLPPAA